MSFSRFPGSFNADKALQSARRKIIDEERSSDCDSERLSLERLTSTEKRSLEGSQEFDQPQEAEEDQNLVMLSRTSLINRSSAKISPEGCLDR